MIKIQGKIPTEVAHRVYEGVDEDKAHDKAQFEMWQDIHV